MMGSRVDMSWRQSFNQAIQKLGPPPEPIVLPKSGSLSVSKVVGRMFTAFGQSFPYTGDSTRNILMGMGSLFGALLALGIVNVGHESHRLFAKVCVLAQMSLMGYEAYKRMRDPDQSVPPLTQLNDYIHNYNDEAVSFKQLLHRITGYFTSAPGFYDRLMRNCAIFGAGAQIAAVIYFLAFNEKGRFLTAALSFEGTVVGTFIGAIVTLSSVESESRIDRWKRRAIKEGVLTQFEDFIARQLNRFTCPFTKKLILVPMKDDEGVVYERAAIKDQLDQGNFVYDDQYHVKLAHVIDSFLHQPETSVSIKDGLIAYRTTIMKARAKLIQEVVSDIQIQVVYSKLSNHDLDMVRDTCGKYYAILPWGAPG
jgi:hypothetical protein